MYDTHFVLSYVVEKKKIVRAYIHTTARERGRSVYIEVIILYRYAGLTAAIFNNNNNNIINNINVKKYRLAGAV